MGRLVFENYDQVQLDQEYNLHQRVPGREKYLKDYINLSKQVDQAHVGLFGFDYGLRPKQTIDIFPAKVKPAPVHIFLHGDYWHLGCKEMYRFVASGIVNNDILLVLPDYDHLPKVRFGSMLDQLIGVISWVYENINMFGGDRDRITISAHGSGAHLAALLLCTDFTELGLPVDVIKGGVALSGIYDLRPLQLCYLNQDTLYLSDEDVGRYSPIFLTPENESQLYLPVGDLESDEYHRQSIALETAWARSRMSVQYFSHYCDDHFSMLMHLSNPKSSLARMVACVAKGIDYELV